MVTFNIKIPNGTKVYIYDQLETRVDDDNLLKYLLSVNSENLVLKVHFVGNECPVDDLISSKVSFCITFLIMFFSIKIEIQHKNKTIIIKHLFF